MLNCFSKKLVTLMTWLQKLSQCKSNEKCRGSVIKEEEQEREDEVEGGASKGKKGNIC